MAIGRISGQLLKDNLLRDGVNLKFENDLLYLLVSDEDGANHKVGIKNTNPAYTLDITGTTRSTEYLGSRFEVDEVEINDNYIKSTIGDFIIKAATTNDIVKIQNDVLINGNLHATGSITADGSLTFGDSNTDNIVFLADINSDIIPNLNDAYDLGSSTQTWRSLFVDEIKIYDNTISNFKLDGNLIITANGSGVIELVSFTRIDSDLEVLGGNITLSADTDGVAKFNTTAFTANVFNEIATTVNIAGAATLVEIGSSTGTTNINNNLEVDGDVMIDGGDLRVSTTEFNLIPDVATTVNFAGAATNLLVGATTGTTNVRNNLEVDGDVMIDGGDLRVSTTEFNLIPDVATTVNFATSATTLEIGAATGTTNINNNLEVDGDVMIDGGDLRVSTTEFNLIPDVATSVNFAGAATNIEIASNVGNTNVNNNLNVKQNLNVQQNLDVDGDVNIDGGDLTVSTDTFNLANETATTINFAGAATTIEIGSNQGNTNVNNNLNVDLNLTVGQDLIVDADMHIGQNLDVDGDVNIDGGDLTVSTETFNLANQVAKTVNFAGEATNIEIGSGEGLTNVNNNLKVDGETTVGNKLTVDGIVDVNNHLYVEGAARVNQSLEVEDSIKVQNELAVEGDVNLTRDLNVGGYIKGGQLIDTIIDCGEY